MRVETEEVSYERLGSCVSWTCFTDWGRLKLHILFFKIVVGRFVCGKWGDHQKKKFFLNNSV